MININTISTPSTQELFKQKSSLPSNTDNIFSQHLKSAINSVNEQQINSQNAMGDLASGQVKDLHQAALAIDKAEISMKLMLEIRNKALNAYKELGRTQL